MDEDGMEDIAHTAHKSNSIIHLFTVTIIIPLQKIVVMVL